MSRSHHLLPAVCIAMSLAFAGCGSGQRQWEITYENKSDVPCSFFITLGADGSGSAKVEKVAKGKPTTLIVGSSKTIVQSVRVVTDKGEETLSLKIELPVGKRFAVSVGADGKATAFISDR